MIKLTNLTKQYGDYTAVNNLNLNVEKGELFGFLGPNGAGKTTTIKIMTGILKPTAGTVEISGLDIIEKPREAKLKIGYIPDNPFLYDRLSGREYLEFVGGLFHLDDDTIKKRSEELFRIFHMTGWVDKKCEEYSHGMRQKIVFCAAFLHRPDVLVIDEPIVGLDPQSTKLLKDQLRNYASRGTTIFVSTHILSIAEELCNRIGIINKGRLIGLGTVDELKSSNENPDLESLFLKLVETT